jgi:hypothetical protein
VIGGRKPIGMPAATDAHEETKDTVHSTIANNEQRAVKTHLIPPRFFKDFEDMKLDMEPIFQFVAFFVTLNVLDKMQDDRFCIEFPSCIGSEGRRILHEVANYFQLAHHSQGKDRNRRTYMYPRS